LPVFNAKILFYINRAVCGDLVSEGEGNSKKDSKKKAAENMLIKLKESVSPTSDFRQKVKNLANKKKNRNLIKVVLYLSVDNGISL